MHALPPAAATPPKTGIAFFPVRVPVLLFPVLVLLGLKIVIELVLLII
jgi:hypothetical protein